MGEYNGKIIYEARDYVVQFMNLKFVGYLENHGAFACVLEKNRRNYVLVAVPYCMFKPGKGICKSVSLDAVEYAVKNNAQLLFYCDEGKYVWYLDAQLISRDVDNNTLQLEPGGHRNQEKIDLVPLQKYGGINVVADRRNCANLIEDHLTIVFRGAIQPVIFTGDKAIIAGRKPDWIIHLQKKVVLYMGLRYHSEDEIIKEIEDYNNLGYKVYWVRSDEYSNNDMNGWKDKLILDRINLFISSDLSKVEIDEKLPLTKPLVKKQDEGQTTLIN